MSVSKLPDTYEELIALVFKLFKEVEKALYKRTDRKIKITNKDSLIGEEISDDASL